MNASTARTIPQISIPHDMLPADGRFGSGPSKIRPEQIEAIAAAGRTIMGTSHRQPPVRAIVASIREGLLRYFHAPDGYEVVLGNGGASAFWEVACACLIERRAAFGVFGSFSGKFAQSAANAPFLEKPAVYEGEFGTSRLPEFTEGVDAYAWPHNETSTGVATHIARVPGSLEQGALTLIDATSGAGGLPVDLSQADAYYFSPQKAFGSDGGLWVAILSPAAMERAQRVEASAKEAGSTRWVPPFLSLTKAIDNSRKNQTLNTPALATLIMMDEQIKWLNAQGGLDWAAKHCAASAQALYDWAERIDFGTPFVKDPADRSHVVVTIDIDESIDAAAIVAALRDNGIVDVFPYRKLGRNQLRVGVFPSVDTADVEALTACVDYVVPRLADAGAAAGAGATAGGAR